MYSTKMSKLNNKLLDNQETIKLIIIKVTFVVAIIFILKRLAHLPDVN